MNNGYKNNFAGNIISNIDSDIIKITSSNVYFMYLFVSWTEKQSVQGTSS